MTTNFSMPTQLTGTLADLWNEIKNQAGDNPEAPVKITAPDQEKMNLIEALAAVGGCKFVKVADGVDVTLCFAPEVPADEAGGINDDAIVKKHTFAKKK